MKLGIAMPWRPQPTRLRAKDATVKYYEEELPDAKIYYADYPSTKFNLSASRNLATEAAIADGCDVILIVDADCLIHRDPLKEAIEKASKQNLIFTPYTDLMFADENISNQLINGEVTVTELIGRPIPILNWQVGGAYVMNATVFEEFNGWDERFVGWGFEDMAMQSAHIAIKKSHQARVNGLTVCLSHKDRDKELVKVNEKLWDYYVSLQTDEVAMREHIKGNRINK